VSEEERIEFQKELSVYSKEELLDKYIDELEENCSLSNLWCKSQEENERLNELVKGLREKYENLLTDYRISIEKRVKLEQKIDKAIEYIENNVLTYINEDDLESITDKEENELIKILGSDKE